MNAQGNSEGREGEGPLVPYVLVAFVLAEKGHKEHRNHLRQTQIGFVLPLVPLAAPALILCCLAAGLRSRFSRSYCVLFGSSRSEKWRRIRVPSDSPSVHADLCNFTS